MTTSPGQRRAEDGLQPRHVLGQDLHHLDRAVRPHDHPGHVLGPLQRFLDATSLDVQQWLICLCVSLSIIVISEIRKIFQRRSAEPVAEAEVPAPQVAAVAAGLPR
jgi:hypothetical protein